MGFGSIVLRFFNLAIRVLQFLDSAVILGIFSYYLAALARNDLPIAQWIRAVEGMSGAATLYALLGVLLSCCLGGITFFAFLAVVLDVCFVGVMIAIAVLTRHGTQSCTSNRVVTPLGTGASHDDTAVGITFHRACQLEKAAFAVAIIGIAFFLISILFQILLARHHKREKRFGPSPSNGYTYGRHRRGGWFSRKNKGKADVTSADNTLPAHPPPDSVELGAGEKNRYGAARPYGYGNSAYTANY